MAPAEDAEEVAEDVAEDVHVAEEAAEAAAEVAEEAAEVIEVIELGEWLCTLVIVILTGMLHVFMLVSCSPMAVNVSV